MTMQKKEAKTNTREDVKFTIDYLHNYMMEVEERLKGVRDKLAETRKALEEEERRRREIKRRILGRNSGMTIEEIVEARKELSDDSSLARLYELKDHLKTLENRYTLAEHQAGIAATLLVLSETPAIFTYPEHYKKTARVFDDIVLKKALEPLHDGTIIDCDGVTRDCYIVSVWSKTEESGNVYIRSASNGRSLFAFVGMNGKFEMDMVLKELSNTMLLSADEIELEVEEAYRDRAVMKERYNSLYKEMDVFNNKYRDLDGFYIHMPYIY